MADLDKDVLEDAIEAYWAAKGGSYNGVDAAIRTYIAGIKSKPDNDLTTNNVAQMLRKLYGTHPVCLAAADQIDLLVEALAKGQKNLRHWRDEVGKLHCRIDCLKGDLKAWEITFKRIEETDSLRASNNRSECCDLAAPALCSDCPDSNGSCPRCGESSPNTSALCATCIDQDSVRKFRP